MSFKKTLKKLYRFAIDNYFIAIFLASIAFVAVVSIYKLFFVKPTYVYVKVKMGQGLWWASTQKPSLWFIESIKKAKNEPEKDLVGKPQAQILSIRYYPWWGSNQYDVYLMMKLKVSKLGKTGKYNFKRSSIGIGSPVDFEFPSLQFSGTVIALSEKPIKEKFIQKTIILTKKNANPWEYESIKLGDSYFDGEEKVFEVLEKSAKDTQTITSDSFGNYPIDSPELKKYIFVKARVLVKQKGSKLLFGEEQVIASGKTINISTDNFQFADYLVAKVE
ncbi:MAG: hypothetical protein ACK4FL_02020 [Microgenomates group bacterium]